MIPLRCAVVATGAVFISASVPRLAAPIRAPVDYVWANETRAAAFDGAYNFPVFVVRGEMWAFHPRGFWFSRDARTWTRSSLPESGLNSGYQKYVAFGGAVYALGTMTGNYLDLHLTSRIARTKDLRQWEVMATQSELPPRVFYGAVVHAGRIWLMGGFDGHAYFNDVWSSTDAVHWTRVLDHAPWSPRNVDMTVEFKGQLWVIGGGVIDGQPDPNPDSKREVWSSVDGVRWVRHQDRTGAAWGGAPVVYDNQLWLIAANRNSTFAPSLLATADGESWREEAAPWSPRGAPAVWVAGDKLYMAGGKYSVMERGTPRFIYRNDVWSMMRR
jgi:Kelch motif